MSSKDFLTFDMPSNGTTLDLGSITASESGLDAFFSGHPEVVSPASSQPAPTKTARVKVASLGQLSPFVRTAEHTLVHKIDRDLWSLQKDASGTYFIQRLFDDAGNPIKG